MDSEKNKKFFSIAAPHRQPAEKGEGVRVKKVAGYTMHEISCFIYMCAHTNRLLYNWMYSYTSKQ